MCGKIFGKKNKIYNKYREEKILKLQIVHYILFVHSMMAMMLMMIRVIK